MCISKKIEIFNKKFYEKKITIASNVRTREQKLIFIQSLRPNRYTFLTVTWCLQGVCLRGQNIYGAEEQTNLQIFLYRPILPKNRVFRDGISV